MELATDFKDTKIQQTCQMMMNEAIRLVHGEAATIDDNDRKVMAARMQILAGKAMQSNFHTLFDEGDGLPDNPQRIALFSLQEIAKEIAEMHTSRGVSKRPEINEIFRSFSELGDKFANSLPKLLDFVRDLNGKPKASVMIAGDEYGERSRVQRGAFPVVLKIG